MESGAFEDLPTRNRAQGHVYEERVEAFRFAIADNPELIKGVSDNVRLGHSFLRSMERSYALVYVVDLSGPAPWDELRMLREELKFYKNGMSKRARMVIANKADLLADEGDLEELRLARAKLAWLKEFFMDEMGHDEQVLDVVPTSGKNGQNLRCVVRKLRALKKSDRHLGRHPCPSNYPMYRSRNQSYFTFLFDTVHELYRYHTSTHFDNVSLAIKYLSRVPWTTSSLIIQPCPSGPSSSSFRKPCDVGQ